MSLVKNILISLLGITTLAGGCTAINSLYVVNQGQHAVVTRFGKPVRVVFNPLKDEVSQEKVDKVIAGYNEEGIPFAKGPGLYTKTPFIESVRKLDRRIQRWNGAPEEINTSDKKYLFTDATARWFIQDPLKFVRTVGTEEQAHARLDDVIDSITRTAITKRPLVEIVRSTNREMLVTEPELKESVQVGKVEGGRQKVMNEVCQQSAEVCQQFGIGIVPQGYLIRGLVYVEEVKKSVEARMSSERARIASKYLSEGEGEAKRIDGQRELDLRTITSEAYMKSQIIRGQAEAEAIKIYAEAYGRSPEFYGFLQSMQLYQDKLGKDTKLVIGTDNDLFRYLKSAEPPTQVPTKK